MRHVQVVASTGDDLVSAVTVRQSTPHHVAFASTSGVFDRSARPALFRQPLQPPAELEQACSGSEAVAFFVPSAAADRAATPIRLAIPSWAAGGVSSGAAEASPLSRSSVDASGRTGPSILRWSPIRDSEMLLDQERADCATLFGRGESRELTRSAVVCSLDHHPLLPLFASGGVAGQVLLWRPGRRNGLARYAQTWATSGPAQQQRIGDVQWSPDGTRLLAVDAAGGCWLWDSTRPERPIDAQRIHTRSAHAAAFLDAGSVFAVAGSSDSASTPPHPAAGSHSLRSTMVDDALAAVGLPPSGPQVMRHALIPPTLPLQRAVNPSVRILDARCGNPSQCVATFSAVEGTATSIAFAPGDHAVIVGGSRGGVGMFDLRAMGLLSHADSGTPAHSRAVRAIAVDPSGAFVASGGTDGLVRFWSLPKFEDAGSVRGLFAERTFVGHKLGDGMLTRFGVTDMVFTSEHLLVSGTGGFVYALPKRWD